MAAWARGVVINGTITALSMGLLFGWIGVQPALVFAVIAFLGEFVPMIGPVIASVPALFVALSMGFGKFGLALLVVLFVHQVETNLLIPFVLPAAAIFKIAIEEFYLRERRLNEAQITAQAKQIYLR
jgi:putative permease